MGVTIGGDAAKSGKHTYLLVIMRVRLSQKTFLIDLMDLYLSMAEVNISIVSFDTWDRHRL